MNAKEKRVQIIVTSQFLTIRPFVALSWAYKQFIWNRKMLTNVRHCHRNYLRKLSKKLPFSDLVENIYEFGKMIFLFGFACCCTTRNDNFKRSLNASIRSFAFCCLCCPILTCVTVVHFPRCVCMQTQQ